MCVYTLLMPLAFLPEPLGFTDGTYQNTEHFILPHVLRLPVLKVTFMQLAKKDKILLCVAGGLLVIVVIVYALYYGGNKKSDPIKAEEYSKGVPSQTTPTGKKVP